MGVLGTAERAWKGGVKGHTSPYPFSRWVPPGAQQKWLKVGLKLSTFLLLDSWVQAESGLKSGLTLTSVGLADSDSDSDPLDSDSDSGPMDSDSDSGPMDSDSGLMDSDSDSDSGLVDSDSLPDSRVRTHSNTAYLSKQLPWCAAGDPRLASGRARFRALAPRGMLCMLFFFHPPFGRQFFLHLPHHPRASVRVIVHHSLGLTRLNLNPRSLILTKLKLFKFDGFNISL